MKSNVFQIALLGAFGLAAGVGMIAFSMFKADNASLLATPLVIWGTIDQKSMAEVIANGVSTYPQLNKVTYVQKTRSQLYDDLIEELASQGGPDMVIMDDDKMLAFANKAYTIPFTSYEPKLFRDTFIEGGEIFMWPTATFAVPFSVDPLVMFYNRDLFTSAGITQVPVYWDDFMKLIPRLTKIPDGSTITQSAVALGEYSNVLHAKEILSMLIMQAGSPIVSYDATGLHMQLTSSKTESFNPTGAALNFYTQFANPILEAYSWNRSFPRSREAFLAGRLAVYFGFASEVQLLQETNPNLNLDVAVVPQPRNGRSRVTFGQFQGIVIMKSSRDPARAFQVAVALTAQDNLARLSTYTSLPPIRRDLLGVRPTDPFRVVVYDSAIIAKSWLEPDALISDRIFESLISDVTGGKRSLTDAVSIAENSLNAAYKFK